MHEGLFHLIVLHLHMYFTFFNELLDKNGAVFGSSKSLFTMQISFIKFDKRIVDEYKGQILILKWIKVFSNQNRLWGRNVNCNQFHSEINWVQSQRSLSFFCAVLIFSSLEIFNVATFRGRCDFVFLVNLPCKLHVRCFHWINKSCQISCWVLRILI